MKKTQTPKRNSDIRLVQMSEYFRPPVEIKNNAEWVLNGATNSFYDYLIARYNGSSTHSAILNSYTDLTYGQGLINKNSNVEDWLLFNRMITPAEVLKVITDYTVYGEAILQIVKANGKDKLPTVYHMQKEYTAPNKANEDNEIEGYWYCEDWSQPTKAEYDPVFFPILSDDTKANCYPIKPYRVGAKYFSDPQYIAGLPYAIMEEEIANYYTSHIKNGLSFGYIVNIPDGNSYTPEEKDALEKQITKRLTGSTNAGKFIINFNGRDAEITIVAIEVNDAHSQWAYLTSEARQQLLTAHRVTSPMLLGIKDNTGFGNNADEMDTAEAQLMKRVIRPRQRVLLDAFQTIAEFYGLKVNLDFKPLSEVVIAPKPENVRFSEVEPTELERVLEFYAQDEPEGYELNSIEFDLSFSAIQKSVQDSDLYKVRYAYSKGTRKQAKGQSRDFCNKMVSLSENGKVYRKEDIEKMSEDGVNGQFAHEGGKYNIFLYAGGVNCHHRWERRIYKKKRGEDGKPLIGNAMQNTDYINVNQAVREGFKPAQNPADVAIAEIDKPNKGRFN
jgi:hypothetical protein